MDAVTGTSNAFLLGCIVLSLLLFAWGNRFWRFKEQPAPTLLFIGIRSLIGSFWAAAGWWMWSGDLPSWTWSAAAWQAVGLGGLGFLGLWAFVRSLNSDHSASALVGQSLNVVVGFAVGTALSGTWPSRYQLLAATLLLSIQLLLLFRRGGIRGWIPAAAGLAYGLYYPLSVPALRELGPLSFFLVAEWTQGLLALALGTVGGEWKRFNRPLLRQAGIQAAFSTGGQLAYFGALGAAALPQVVLLSGLGFSVNYLALHRPKSNEDWAYLAYFGAAGLTGAWLTLMN